MRFAGSEAAVDALGVYSGYDPSALSQAEQRSRSMQRQYKTAAEALVEETGILNEAELEAAKLGVAAKMAQVPGMGEVIGTSILEGLGNAAGPIAKGLKGTGYGGTGSTGTTNTVRVGDTGKYGDAFVDPMESFRKLGYTDSQIDMNTGSSLIRR